MGHFPIQALPRDAESASGFMLRLCNLNGAQVKDAMAYCRAAQRAKPLASEADLLAELAGAASDWFGHRLPRPQARDQWPEVGLFGHTWREPWLLRGAHQQVCATCLDETGIARLEWDLVAYPVCHIHGIPLQDACGVCGNAISPDRPALDVCNCGAYITTATRPARAIEPRLISWVSWLSQQLLPEDTPSHPADNASIAHELRGTSPDGAFRLILAFAGGIKALRGSRLSGEKAWLRSDDVASLLTRGLNALNSAACGQLSGLGESTSYALADQSVAGITAWDRAAAAREMRRLRLGRRWRNAVPRCPLQQDLFKELP